MTATIRIPKRSKFNVDQSSAGKLERTFMGRVYASKAEARYAARLETLKKAGDIAVWTSQFRVQLRVNKIPVTTMVIDFAVAYSNGTCEYIEIKGYRTAVFKLQEKLFRALHPKVLYTVIDAKDVR